MYFSKVEFTGRTPKVDWLIEDLYQKHRTLWRLFRENAEKRDFLFREISERPSRFYLVSEKNPKRDDKFWRVETKEYNPRIVEKQQFRFSLRANPTISKKKPEDGKSRRHDVVMDAKARMKISSGDNPRDLVFESGLEWLEKRSAANGFKLLPGALSVDGYLQHVLPRKNYKIKISSLDFDGILEVTDAELFRKCLFQGLGPARSFGCGLLMIMPCPEE